MRVALPAPTPRERPAAEAGGGCFATSRRQCLVWAASTALGAAVAGCADRLAGIPRFAWGKPVDFRDVRFDFEAVRSGSSIEDMPSAPVSRTGHFVILAVTMTNRANAAIPPELRPVFRLLDRAHAMYAPRGTWLTDTEQASGAALVQSLAMLPQRPTRQVVVFDVPERDDYVLLVTMPTGKALHVNGNVSPLESHFVVDIAAPLARSRRVAHGGRIATA